MQNFQIKKGSLLELWPFAVDLRALRVRPPKRQEEILAELRKDLTDDDIWASHGFCPRFGELQNEYRNFRLAHPNRELTEDWDKGHCLCRETAKGFPRKKHDKNAFVSFFIGNTHFMFKKHRIMLTVWADLYPNRNFGILCFNIPLDGLSVDETIALKHYFHKTEEDETAHDKESYRDFIGQNERLTSGRPLRCFGRHLVNRLVGSKRLSDGLFSCLKDKRHKAVISDTCLYVEPAFTHSCVEINVVAGWPETIGQDFLREKSLPLYGLLTGDEGYSFVSENLATQHIQQYAWQTRTFKYICAFGNDVLMLNLKSGHGVEHTNGVGEAYIEKQKDISNEYHTPQRQYYFAMTPCIACIDHCVLDAFERNICIAFEAQYLLRSGNKLRNRPNAERQMLVNYYNMTTPTTIEELNELSQTLAQATRAMQMAELMRNRLMAVSQDTEIAEQGVHKTILALFAIFSVVVGIFAIGCSPAIFSCYDNHDALAHCCAVGISAIIIIITIICIIIEKNKTTKP